MSVLGAVLKIVLPVAAVGTVVAVVAGGDDKPRVTKHGLTMVGNCEEFVIGDFDEAVEWLRAYKLPGQLDDEPEVIEAVLVNVFKSWWPDCTWPPLRQLRPGEGGPQVVKFEGHTWDEGRMLAVVWAETRKKNKQHITLAGLVAKFFGFDETDLEAGEPGPDGPMPKPDDKPKPVPPILGDSGPTPEPSDAAPPNWVSLDTAPLFAEFDVRAAMDPKAAPLGSVGDTPRALLLGVSGSWADAPRSETLERFLRLATNDAELNVAVFDLAVAREILGIDPGDLAWVATAVGPSGEFYPQPVVGRGLARPPGAGELTRLAEFARRGFRDPTTTKVYTYKRAVDGRAHTVVLMPAAKGWRWLVWKGPRGFERDAMKTGKANFEMQARTDAGKFIETYATVGYDKA